jgi:glycosyltransferase involved in cell wall biosynthesis
MARMLAKNCGPPVVCQLSGEDIFLEKLPQPFYDQARLELRARAHDVDAFVSINGYYADYMADYLAIDRARIHVIPHGLLLNGHGMRVEKKPHEPRVIGYFARICEDKGLHLFVDACERLAVDSSLPPFVVRAAGYLGNADRPYLEKIVNRASAGPLAGRFEYLGELDRVQKIAFLQSLDVMSVPTVYREAKGISPIEALANAVPVVLPAHGSFPELIADTGGGLLFQPLNPADLAEKLAQLLRDPQQAATLGLVGQQAVQDRYHARRMAEQTLDLYRRLATRAATRS